MNTVYFPSGRPCPPLLTEAEVRIDTLQIQHPEDTLRRYRDAGLLRGTQVSKGVFYRPEELLAFLDRQTEEVKR